MRDLAEDGFLGRIKRNFQFHVQDIDVAVAFMSACIHVIGLRFWELRFQGKRTQQKKCERKQVFRCRWVHRFLGEF